MGNWADRHPYFRNFPPFAAFSALLFLVVSFRLPSYRHTDGPKHFPFRLAFVVFVAVAFLGAALEFLQQLVPVRKEYAHPLQIMWSTAGAFAGAFAAALLSALFYNRAARTPAPEIDSRDTVTPHS